MWLLIVYLLFFLINLVPLGTNNNNVHDFRAWGLQSADIKSHMRVFTQFDRFSHFKMRQKFELPVKYVDMAAIYRNVRRDSRATFDIGFEMVLNLTLNDGRAIDITVAKQDIEYCAALWHPPFTALLVKISESFANKAVTDLLPYCQKVTQQTTPMDGKFQNIQNNETLPISVFIWF